MAAVAIFVALEFSLGVIMHTADGKFPPFAYMSIILAAAFNFLSVRNTPRFWFTVSALGLTLVADYFLVVMGSMYTVAMAFFSMAQLSYAARVHTECGARLGIWHIFTRAILSMAAIVIPFLVLGEGVDALAVISVFYFANLLLNLVFSIINIRKFGGILPLGFFLFLLCDIFVGFGNLSGYLPIVEGTLAYWIAYPPINMAWVFYLPSQTLLGMSLAFDKE